MLNERARRTREINAANGWNPVTRKDWDKDPYRIPSMLALIHSEINEAHKEYADSDHEALAEEFADVEIRILDLAGGLVGNFDARVRSAWGSQFTVPQDTNLAFMVAHHLVTNALEYYREDNSGLFVGELAKLYTFIRAFAVRTFGLDMGIAVEAKLEKNSKRGYRHGGKRV